MIIIFIKIIKLNLKNFKFKYHLIIYWRGVKITIIGKLTNNSYYIFKSFKFIFLFIKFCCIFMNDLINL